MRRIAYKYLSLLLLIFAAYASVHAQIRLAAYGGIHSANVIENNNIPGWDTATKPYYSPITGFHLGVLAEIPLGNKGFYFQPGIGYSSRGRQYEKFYDTSLADKDTVYLQTSLKLGYIEIPLYMTYKLPLSSNHKNNFFISAGPYFAFFYNGTMNQQSQTLIYNTNKYQYNNDNTDLATGNATAKYKTLDIGINAKAGFELGNIMLSAYFSRGLSNFYTAPYDGSFHHQLFGATLGIWLTKPIPAPAKTVKDSDKDGIPDEQDACPLQPGTIAWHGCPVPDTDHDGIDDEHDSCKTVAGVEKYHGCPIPDSDGDGINDEEDSCKTVPGVAKYHGCPIPDTDGDGVNDEEDNCPNEPGVAENHGCPIVKKPARKITYAGKNVQFKSSSSTLTKNSYSSLDALADTLKAYPELHLTIEGHADNTGVASQNQVLSQQRAEAVKSYLVTKGISPNKITAIGYGQERPVGDNKTIQGKAANRRVAFRLEVENN
jgi:outer membrane protein OmpA-like peptidoglycan-associated protein